MSGPLAAYLVLLHVRFEAAKGTTAPPELHMDIFTLWAAAGTELRQYLKREGSHIVCPELNTRYSTAG